MKQTVLNQELKVTIPDGFHEMSEAEHGNLNLLKEAPDWCISDPDRHILLSVAWKKQSLASMLLSSGDVAENMEKSLRKPMAAYGYKLEGFLEESLDGTTASGFRYSYTAQGIGMTGESFSVKKGKTFYYIHCYLRSEFLEESLPVLKEIFASWKWL